MKIIGISANNHYQKIDKIPEKYGAFRLILDCVSEQEARIVRGKIFNTIPAGVHCKITEYPINATYGSEGMVQSKVGPFRETRVILIFDGLTRECIYEQLKLVRYLSKMSFDRWQGDTLKYNERI